MKTYTVDAAYSQADAECLDRCSLSQEFDTLKAAKEFARRVLTSEYQALIEASAPFNYSRVMDGRDCKADYFRKGYVCPASEPIVTDEAHGSMYRHPANAL